MAADRCFHVMRRVGKQTLCGLFHEGYMKGEAEAAILFNDFRDGDRHNDGWRSVCVRCKQIFDSARGGIYRMDGRLDG